MKLWQYQQETVDKLFPLQIGLDGSDMGTGKTISAIDLAIKWRQKVVDRTGKLLPILVVTPINTFSSWEEKLALQCPELNVMTIDRKNRKAFVESIKSKNPPDLMICHYECLRLIVKDLKRYTFSVIVADEVHKISNRNIQQTQALKKLKTYHKIGMSGTASGDKAWGLWSVLNWLDKKTFSSYWKFVDRFVVYENKVRTVNGETVSYKQFLGTKNIDQLHKMIKPFYVRHLKDKRCCPQHPDGVNPFLPPKVNKRLTVELKGEQLRLYKEMEKKMVAWLGEERDEPIVAPILLTKLQRLNQFSLATPVLDDDHMVSLTLPSAKFDALKELVTEYDDKKFLVFTSSKLMADLVFRELKKLGIAVGLITGDTKEKDRRELSTRMENGDFRIIVATIRAAAEGIDGLQKTCSTAVFLDRDLSTIKNAQAEDRLHRSGQKNSVTIIDIVATNGGIDARNISNLSGKWSQISEVLNVK